jgi:hypothetical protein
MDALHTGGKVLRRAEDRSPGPGPAPATLSRCSPVRDAAALAGVSAHIDALGRAEGLTAHVNALRAAAATTGSLFRR